MDEEELKDLLEDVIEALANKRLMQKKVEGKVGVELTTRLINRCKDVHFRLCEQEKKAAS